MFFDGYPEDPEPQLILHAMHWEPLRQAEQGLIPDEFRYDESAKTFEFDLQGERMRYLVKQGISYTPSRAAFGHQFLQKILRNRFYIGEIESDGEWYPASHAPIVSASLFMKVQKLLGNRRQQAHEHPYGGGLLKCAHCGAAVVGELIRGRYRYYRCDTKGHPKTRTNGVMLDEQIAKTLEKFCFTPAQGDSDQPQ